MQLQTNLKHLMSEANFRAAISENKNVMICCGRMGPMCIPVYKAMTSIRADYPHVEFYDMAFDLPDAKVIRNLPACGNFMGLPFTVYFQDGAVVAATSSIQSEQQVKAILDKKFSK